MLTMNLELTGFVIVTLAVVNAAIGETTQKRFQSSRLSYVVVDNSVCFQTSAAKSKLDCARRCALAPDCSTFAVKASAPEGRLCQGYKSLLTFQSSDLIAHGGPIYYTLPSNDSNYSTCGPFGGQQNKTGTWLVIYRLCDGSENFNRSWEDFSKGFGDPRREFWFGLEMLHYLTTSGTYELTVDMEHFDGTTSFATYSNFSIAAREQNYRLNFQSFVGGTAEDRLSASNGQPFSTWDVDNDEAQGSCARQQQGAWWHDASCSTACNLLGPYRQSNGCPAKTLCPYWTSPKGLNKALKTVEMTLRAA